MRKIMMAAAALVAMAGTAQAQGATQQVNLTANVGGYCTIDGGASGTVRSGTVSTSSGKATAGALTLTGGSGNVICTSNATIQLTTANGGLTNGPTPADTNYTNKIHYTATATYNGVTETLTTTDATVAGFTTAGSPTLGAQTNVPLALAVNVAATPANKFLVGGSYSDTITVRLIPN
jgi:opacity protein-like surface antigen